ncbi:hypothetical protein EGW08_016543 [Elysia chlorotica]|uniref:Protein kinase domain-containing protein n=1 Tax=Elysia chlorotica TaxID=188477 RepID=A0A433T2B9_ELYCH|nr:hypothetical protein EGW08_016543 [Elysia chlorotica]
MMAEAVKMENSTGIYYTDLKGEDIFKKYGLKKRETLGKGSAGKVYLVQTKDGHRRTLALKKFSLTHSDRELKFHLFSREAEFMQIVNHPHLVPCIMAACCDKYAAIVMPYYPQGDLVLEGRQEPRLVHRLMSHVARALEHLHKHNIAHNDLKLENIFMDGSGRAHLGDLGLAIKVEDGSGTAPAWRVGGTDDYWAPEKLEAEHEDNIDPFKCDVYALGIMYFTLVTGQDFEAGTDFLAGLQCAKGVDLSTAQRSTLERLLEPNPAERPTASQVVIMMNKK